MDHELAELIQSVDPRVLGARIKTARIAAGLRQHQLAEGVSSVPYISRIEAGTRRPGLDLLAVIAERTQTTPAALLRGLPDGDYAEIELELHYAQLELTTGDAQASLARLDTLSARIPDGYMGPLTRSLRQLRAGALEAIGDIHAAIQELEALLDEGADESAWLAAATSLSRCYRQAGQFRSAIEMGERAKARLTALDLEGTTEGIQLSLSIAGALFEHGDVADAIDVCTRAIAQAEKIESPRAKASAYWNASVIESRRGNSAGALKYARAAIPLIEEASDARNVARLRGQYGILLLRSGDPAGARTTLQQTLTELQATDASAADRATARTALAECELLLGDIDAARATLAVVEAADMDSLPMARAERAMLLGRIAAASANRTEALADYREALDILTGITADRGVGEVWFELAALLDEAGDSEGAQTAYRAAAASAGFAARTSARLTSS
ncbi:MAG: helix-turn-helix domain-containing protein [Marmoricola sp.]